MKKSLKEKIETDRTNLDAIVARILAKGGIENALGLPGWRWFQFDTNVDPRNWYVSDSGQVKCGENFREAKEVKV